MKLFIIEFKGIDGEFSKAYQAINRKDALNQAVEDGAFVVKEIEQGGVQ